MSLTQQPALLSRAFQRLFAKEIAAATNEAAARAEGAPSADVAAGADPAASWLAEGFWRRSPDKHPRPLPPSAPAAGGQAAAPEQASSRYLTDFQVRHFNAH